MNLKKSCNWLSRLFSGTLFCRSLLQFWMIPVLGSVGLIVNRILPLLNFPQMNHKELYGVMEANIYDFDILTLLFLALIPIAAATASFAWLHGKTSAAAIHAQPFSRKKLYISSMTSGYVMSVIPVLCLEIAYLLLLKSTGFHALGAMCSEVFKYFFLTETFVYAVSVLAGMISGTVVTHFLLSMFFNGVLPVTFVMINRYLDAFLFGLDKPPLASVWFSPLTILHDSVHFRNNAEAPMILFVNGSDGSSHLMFDKRLPFLLFTVIAVVLLLLSYRIYRKLPLEREGEAVIYKWPGEVVCYLFAFMGMTITAFQLRKCGAYSNAAFIIAAAVGALVFYTVTRMILSKSVKVLNRKFFLGFLAFCLGAAVFFAFTLFDAYGFERFVPDAKNVESVILDDEFGCDMWYSNEENDGIRNRETIEKIMQFHSAVAKYGDKVQKGKLGVQPEQSVRIEYRMKNGAKYVRSYDISITENPDLYSAYQCIFEDSGYQKWNEHLTLPKLFTLYFTIYPTDNQFVDVKVPQTLLADFEKAFRKDRSSYTFEDTIKLFRYDSKDNFCINYSCKHPDVGISYGNELIITPKDKNMQKLLFENGFSKYMITESSSME